MWTSVELYLTASQPHFQDLYKLVWNICSIGFKLETLPTAWLKRFQFLNLQGLVPWEKTSVFEYVLNLVEIRCGWPLTVFSNTD